MWTKSRAKRVIDEEEELRSVLSVSSVGDKLAGEASALKSVSIRRAIFDEVKERIDEKEELESEQSDRKSVV